MEEPGARISNVRKRSSSPGRSTDVRTTWSPDSELQLLSVAMGIAFSVFLHLNANLIFTLHQTAVITARCNVAKADVVRQGAK